MPEPTNDRLRALGRAARAEVEAGLDTDADLAAVRARAATYSPEPPSTIPLRPAPRTRALVVLGTAAAAVLVVGGIWLLGGDDDAIQTAVPETTLVGTAVTVTEPPVGSSAITPAITPHLPGGCSDIKAHDIGVAGIGGLIVEARLADRSPEIAGCLETVPATFDGSPGRCWSCPGLAFVDRPIVVGETDGAFDFQLAVSTPDGDSIVDTVETWRFDLDGDLLVFAGVEFEDPLASRADSLGTIIAYLDAIEAGDWLTAAGMLDDGAQNSDERPDLRRLDLTDYSNESVAAGLEQWCAAGCGAERPAVTDLEFNGWSHDLVRFGERIRVRWHEGMLSIEGLPPRLPDDPADETPLVDWRDLTYEASGITNSCVRASLHCTRVIHDPNGTPISYDPVTRELTRHGRPEVSVTLPERYGDRPWPSHAGPDDVVYLQVDPATPAEFAADIVAVTLADGDAGREIGRWSEVADNVGDSELIATSDGLVNVNCCGGAVRPDPDAEVLVPWLDRRGDQLTTELPDIRVTIDHPSMTVARAMAVSGGLREWTVTPAGEWLPRGMPFIVPTFDGGFVAATPDSGWRDMTIIRGWPNGDVEQAVLTDADTIELDRSGRVLVVDGERFARVDPFADRTVRPAGQASVDVEAGTVTLPDLSAVTAEWVRDPVAFADAVSGALAVNEQRTVEAEQQSETEWTVIVTTSNFFDDSVFGVRWELTLERADDGRFAFVSGRWSQACQPNRGHQDFRGELCI